MFKDLLFAMGLYKARWDGFFPNTKPGEEPTPGIKKEAGQGPCQICGRATSWRDTVIEAWICSVYCRRKALQELRRQPQRLLEEEFRRIEDADRQRRSDQPDRHA